MTAINRTAYPRFEKTLLTQEVEAIYLITSSEMSFIKSSSHGANQRLTFATFLKTYQHLGYFPTLSDVPDPIRLYVANQLELETKAEYLNAKKLRPSIHRYKTTIRRHLDCLDYTSTGQTIAKKVMRESAYTMSDPADLINAAIERLRKERIDLPAFSTLDRMAKNIREAVHQELYHRITAHLTPAQKQALDALLSIPEGGKFTPFSQLKKNPGTPSLKNIRLWAEHLQAMEAIINPSPFLETISHTKVRQFSAEVSVLQVRDLLDIQSDHKRHAFLLCFLHQTQTRVRDELVEMFLRRIRRTITTAKKRLKELQEEHRALEENLIQALREILSVAGTEEQTDAVFAKNIRRVLQDQGGIHYLKEKVEATVAYHQNNYRPLLWDIHKQHRSVLFEMLDLFQLETATQDQALLTALDFIKQHRHTRRSQVPFDIDLSFASQSWQQLIITKQGDSLWLDRRRLEVCVFIHLADELGCANIFIKGSENYGDPRQQLLSTHECQQRLPQYCAQVGLPDNAAEFIQCLQQQLSEATQRADQLFPGNTELSIDEQGVPHLKRQDRTPKPDNLSTFQAEIRNRMPERHLLDILKHANYWTEYTRHFGPPSGSQPKINQAVSRYLFAIFSNGCLLGDSQMSRHAPESIDRQALQHVNAQHINTSKLEAALTDLVNEYSRFDLASIWGKGKAAIADGTHMPLIENNLMGEHHIRYGGYGGIAYHHISDNYIALFCNFIACGVWEGIYILDGLWQNASEVQPDTLHADTHGQSEPIFGLAHLLGIKLFPRMRNWNDVVFYKPFKDVNYQHIDQLFSDVIDWKLIETHWPDMMQIVLSIQAGKVLPSMLLRKLGSKSRKNKLYRAFRELGRVERTLFLLRYISEAELRVTIRAETTKIESFHSFLDWIAFGGIVIKTGDPVEQAKRMKYMDVIANAIMLQNVTDLTNVLNEMANEGFNVTPELVKSLSPYIREHILRFGKWSLDMEDLPDPLRPENFQFAV